MSKVKTVPQKFETSDGRTFKSKDMAERHERLILAQNTFEAAQRSLNEALAETTLTADGKPFDLKWCDYWFIAPCYRGLPELVRVACAGAYTTKFRVEHATDKDTQVSITGLMQDEKTFFNIRELYADGTAARVALLAARRKRLAELTVEVEGMET